METNLIPKLDPAGHERRVTTLSKVEVRTLEEDAGGAIGFKGHASVFDAKTLIQGWMGDWIEIIARGAFRKTIGEADVRFLINHDPNLVLARNRAGNLRMKEDEIGLSTDAELAPTSYGKDLAISLERGDITQMSFAFEVVKEEWDYDADPAIRTIEEVKLWDVSAVTYPAVAETDAALRSAGFELLCRSMQLDRRGQQDFLKHLIEGQKDPEFAPTLRAAGKALERVARASEPAASHSEVPKELWTALYKKRHLGDAA